MTGLRNPLERAHNHGSAGDGVGHWWAQRFSAMLLVVLTAWLVWALTALVGADHAAATAFLAHPFHATMAILFVATGFYHGQLGLQVVVEDYVHHRALEVALMVTIKALAIFGGLLAVLAILKLALGV
ncbi:succinate dehydrogenase, hydrophobic membrane anchor protein [Wenzhouxiangella sediminis]|uniref:Succinate dehydrogenase hydrophobic membrane anchor subunit n=1 Tax=Wenzhouxiangella sediminis TaxID=1792836 RepID=A0A3E1KAP3_9GAMM|nr:succinate dehydrogenase, hydrophobic membrane anchor protein [Wenzhouxiangella sediminis]RFF31514.1 succinate dehydrogenase, hydrophobic membrane anchor protein [Wenzhouxiangella sediminis]